MPKDAPSDDWSTPQRASRAGTILPPEQEVDCGCDTRLHRPVLRDPTGWNHRINACLRCGTVTVIESLTEEPTPHDVRCVGNRIERVSPKVLAWLAAWPRLAWGVWQQDREVYLPAKLVCQDASELSRHENACLAQQKGLSVAQRLHAAGFPLAPPPKGLPEQMKTFAQTQIGLGLTPEMDLETLLAHLDRTDWAMPFAYKILEARPDFLQITLGLLQSPSTQDRDKGIALIQHGGRKDPEIVGAVLSLLKPAGIDWHEQRWLHTLLDTLYYIGPAAAAARPMLAEIAERIGSSDYYLRKRVEQIRELIKPS